MTCASGECCIKNFFEKFVEQAMESIKPPFSVPTDAKDAMNRIETNMKKYQEFYLFFNGLFIITGSFFSLPFAGILAALLIIGLPFYWPYIKEYVEPYMKQFNIPIPCILYAFLPLLFLVVLFGENLAVFIVFIVLDFIIVHGHAIAQGSGSKVEKKDAPVVEKQTPAEVEEKDE
ncbi:PRA1 family protein [Entamoeba marina]